MISLQIEGYAPGYALHIYIYMAFRSFSLGFAPGYALHIYIYMRFGSFLCARLCATYIYIYIYAISAVADVVTGGSPLFQDDRIKIRGHIYRERETEYYQ